MMEKQPNVPRTPEQNEALDQAVRLGDICVQLDGAIREAEGRGDSVVTLPEVAGGGSVDLGVARDLLKKHVIERDALRKRAGLL